MAGSPLARLGIARVATRAESIHRLLQGFVGPTRHMYNMTDLEHLVNMFPDLAVVVTNQVQSKY